MDYENIEEPSEMHFGNTIRKSLNYCIEGDIVAADVYDNDGQKLLSSNTVINEYIKSHLKLNRIDTIQIYKTRYAKEENRNSDVIKDYMDTFYCVRNLFIDLSAGKKLDYENIKKISNAVKHVDIDQITCINRFINEIQTADLYTYTHSVNVAFYSLFIAKWLGMSEEKKSLAFKCGLLHDIGKTKIPKSLLLKKGPLSKQEYEIMKTHTTLGYQLLIDIFELNQTIKEAVLSHHERLDGSGYPRKIITDNIYARIVAVADVYDAITSDRVYKKKECPFKAFEFFLHEGKFFFDWHILMVFITNMTAILTGSEVMLTSGERARIVYIPPEDPSRLMLDLHSNLFELRELGGISCIVNIII